MIAATSLRHAEASIGNQADAFLPRRNNREDTMKIKTDYWPKPIPYRHFDWSAVDDDTYDGPGSPIGFGRTRDEAIAELFEAMNLRLDDTDYERLAEDQQRRRDAKEGF